MDATLLLATLAEQDGIFSGGVSITSAMDHVDPQVFKTVPFVRVPIKTSAEELFVFRAIEATEVEGGAKLWARSDSEPLGLPAIRKRVRELATSVGFPDFVPYAFRRGLLNALNRPDISTDTRRLVAGHFNSSDTFFNHYMSRRVMIDTQGLFAHGREQRSVIFEHALRCAVPTALTPSEQNGIEERPEVRLLRAERDAVSTVHLTIKLFF